MKIYFVLILHNFLINPTQSDHYKFSIPVHSHSNIFFSQISSIYLLKYIIPRWVLIKYLNLPRRKRNPDNSRIRS